jgi:hypothetical protein
MVVTRSLGGDDERFERQSVGWTGLGLDADRVVELVVDDRVARVAADLEPQGSRPVQDDRPPDVDEAVVPRPAPHGGPYAGRDAVGIARQHRGRVQRDLHRATVGELAAEPRVPTCRGRERRVHRMDLDAERGAVAFQADLLPDPAAPRPGITESALEVGRGVGGGRQDRPWSVEDGPMDRVRRHPVRWQVVGRAGEGEPPPADPTGPRRHHEAAPVHRRAVDAGQNGHPVDEQLRDATSGSRVEVELRRSVPQHDHWNRPDPPRRNTRRSGRSR